MQKLDEIKTRFNAATKGPWGWFGEGSMRQIYLATRYSGRRFVMQFKRWGTDQAQPIFQVYPGDPNAPPGLEYGYMVPAERLITHSVSNSDRPCPPPFSKRKAGCPCHRHTIGDVDNPDARFIANSWEDVDYLLKTIDQMLPVVQAAARQSEHDGLRTMATAVLDAN